MSEAMGRISVLARLLVEQEAAVESAEQLLKDAKAAALKTKREDLPELLREFGMSEFKLTDGTKITIKDDVEARISEEMRGRALSWLMTHEGAGLIKTEVVTAFERGGVENALALAEKLAAEGYGVNVKEVVHPMTLKSFIRDELSKGVAVPFDVFSITPFSFATVKLPKSEK